jgi:AcrR family transcriptional regulator
MRVRHEDTRDQILEVALELFVAEGYETASISEVAERLGITKAAVYYHFPAKEDLLLTLVGPFLDHVDEMLATAVPTGHFPAGRRKLLETSLDVLLKHRTLVCLLSRDVSSLNHPPVGQRVKDQTRRLESMLAGPRGGKAAEVRAVAALGVLRRPLVHLPQQDLSDFCSMLIDGAMAVLSVPLPRKRPGKRPQQAAVS